MDLQHTPTPLRFFRCFQKMIVDRCTSVCRPSWCLQYIVRTVASRDRGRERPSPCNSIEVRKCGLLTVANNQEQFFHARHDDQLSHLNNTFYPYFINYFPQSNHAQSQVRN
jgi:hypothetical protein